MSTLHLAFSLGGLSQCADRLSIDDQIVLLGDATYAQQDNAYLVLHQDAQARGVGTVHSVSYDELVQLTLMHKKVVSWP